MRTLWIALCELLYGTDVPYPTSAPVIVVEPDARFAHVHDGADCLVHAAYLLTGSWLLEPNTEVADEAERGRQARAEMQQRYLDEFQASATLARQVVGRKG